MTYTGHLVEAISYQLVNSGRWVPKVLVVSPYDGNPTVTPLTAFARQHETQAAADGYALTLAQM